MEARGNTYRARVRAPSGKLLSVSGATKAEVQARCERIAMVRRAGAYGEVSQSEAEAQAVKSAWMRVKLADLWRQYLETVPVRHRRRACADWTNRIEKWFGDVLVWEIKSPRLQTWANELVALGYSESTIKTTYHRIGVIVQIAVDDGRLPAKPWGTRAPKISGAREPKEREACRSVQELYQLIQIAQEHDRANWEVGRFSDCGARVAVAALCGLRNGELGGLGWDDVQLPPGPAMVRVRHQVTDGWRERNPTWQRPQDLPKWVRSAAEVRTIALHPAAVRFLEHQRTELQRMGWYRQDGPVFPGKRGIWRDNAKTIKPELIRVLAAMAGLPNPERWTTHSLRHTQATLELLFSHGDVRAVQDRVRHKDPKVLVGYLHSLHRDATPSALPDDLQLAPALGSANDVDAESADPIARLVQSREDVAREIQARRNAAKMSLRRDWRQRMGGKSEGLFSELAADLARRAQAGEVDPEGDILPPEIVELLDRRYTAAYQKEMRMSGSAASAQKKGRAARRATKASWVRSVKAAMRAATATSTWTSGAFSS